jgi:hypothetical protein
MAPLMRVFGASLPMQAMDFSKTLTVSAFDIFPVIWL